MKIELLKNYTTKIIHYLLINETLRNGIDDEIITFLDNTKKNVIKSILFTNKLDLIVETIKNNIKDELIDPEEWVKKNVYGSWMQQQSLEKIEAFIKTL